MSPLGTPNAIPRGTPGPLCSHSRVRGMGTGLLIDVGDTPGASPASPVPALGTGPAPCPLRVPRALSRAGDGERGCSGRRSPGSGPGRSRNDGGNTEWVGEQSAADAGTRRHRGNGGCGAGTARGTLGHSRAAIPGGWAGSAGLHSKAELCRARLGPGEQSCAFWGSPKKAPGPPRHQAEPCPSSAAPAPVPRVSNAELQR